MLGVLRIVTSIGLVFAVPVDDLIRRYGYCWLNLLYRGCLGLTLRIGPEGLIPNRLNHCLGAAYVPGGWN